MRKKQNTLTAKQAAVYLSISKSFFYKQVKEGHLPKGTKEPKYYVYWTKEQLDEVVAKIKNDGVVETPIEPKDPLREGLQELLNVQENAPRPTENQLHENRLMFTLGVGVGVVLTMFLLFLHQQGVL